MQIKVCGMKDPGNINALLSLPIDWIGFIFYDKSPRSAESEVLQHWIENNESAFGNISRTGVFVNAEMDFVLNHLHDYKLDYIQLHGHESPQYCVELRSFWMMSSMRKARIIKAFPIDESFDFNIIPDYEGKCDLFLFDTKGSKAGGNGITFDWQILEKYKGNTPFLLSGGIDSGMEKEIRQLNYPQLIGVDINSKFEIEPGVKDIKKVKEFVEGLK